MHAAGPVPMSEELEHVGPDLRLADGALATPCEPCRQTLLMQIVRVVLLKRLLLILFKCAMRLFDNKNA
jgi:hypothetical protein